ncbi:MAG: NADH:ubiquinone reductase (Na(+)-transporting) subunit A [Elusimicrobia bacterium]|nr:MAG: NADH:ubiquinone reductase (Na(+)-transporting) subunit A [Elusimicrobiota bacterium]
MPTTISIRRGLDLKIAGRPASKILEAPRPARTAVQPDDLRYFRPRLLVKEGDAVKAGTPLLEDKDDPRIVLVSPAGGTVASVHRGERRKILEVIIELAGEETFEEHGALDDDALQGLTREALTERLLKGGFWPLLRQRPFACVANPDTPPKAILVCATPQDDFDTDPDIVLRGQEKDFQSGLDLLAKLTDGTVFLGIGKNAQCPALTDAKGVETRRFAGPYPAGDPAVQIYYACPPKSGETVWYIRAQDLLALARFVKTGRYSTERVIALGGPAVKERQLFKTRVGASIESITDGRLEEGELRVVSGSVLSGRKVPRTGFVGLYDTAVFVLREGRERELLSFFMPGLNKYTTTNTYLGSFLGKSEYALDTNLRGSLRNFTQSGIYESVCPVDIWPEQTAKAVLAGDIEEMEQHGILDCVECGLCTFVCPSKIEVGSILRDGIDLIRKEG